MAAPQPFDDGRTQLLLCVHGLLPISFRGTSYNIPVAVWLTREYPNQPPIAYVVPTNDMLVKAGKYVDVSGRCNIEYTQHWERKSESCNLSALLEAMQDQFSREPPVYAKPPDATNAAMSPPIHASDPRSRPPPPLPSLHPASPPTSSISLDRPAIPQKPAAAAVYSTSSTQSQAVTSPIPGNSSPHRVIPGRPPPPSQSETLPPQYRRVYAGPATPPSYAKPEGVDGPVYYASQHNLQSIVQTINPQSPPPPPPLPPPPPVVAPAPLSYSAHQPHIQQAPPPEHPVVQPVRAPIVNLLDEDSPDTLPNVTPAFAPPPPRPPNPELLRLHEQVHHKLVSELASLSQALALDAERLRAHQTDLLAGEPAIRDEMARLEAVRDVCRSVAGRFKGSVRQAEVNIAELRRKGDPEVDELICSTTIVHNQ
ncbi:hypothetical protein DXG01_014573 [Tephrocybe rancida]|nr:hypothetical protein DXG01_014573 [Tephrocybe rancida]